MSLLLVVSHCMLFVWWATLSSCIDGSPATLFIFFFSSRRRHTRYIGDWSSDVCSSDLVRMIEMDATGALQTTFGTNGVQDAVIANIDAYANVRCALPDGPGITVAASWDGVTRSEERRVGKGCRSGVARGDLKKIVDRWL